MFMSLNGFFQYYAGENVEKSITRKARIVILALKSFEGGHK